MKIEILASDNLKLTSESQAAKKLSEMLSTSFPTATDGTIHIASNVTLSAQQAICIDLVVWGNLTNCKLPAYFEDETGCKKDLLVKNLFTVIEFKNHQASMVSCDGSHVMVEYYGSTKDATSQLERQRYSMQNCLKASNINLFVSGAIWFDSITKAELSNIMQGNNPEVLPSDFGFKDLIDIIIQQGCKPIYDKDNDTYVLSVGADFAKFNLDIIK